MKVAGIQLNPVIGNVEANLERGINYVKTAATEDADLVVFPELWTTGYYLSNDDFRALAETTQGSTISTLRKVAMEHKVSIISTFCEKEEDNLYISAALIHEDGSLKAVLRKSLLWGRERDIFTPGKLSYPTFDTKFGKIGILICYEMEFPETSRLLALEGADLIVSPSVWSWSASRRWDIQLPARALDNTVYVLGVNTVGNRSCGKSKLVGPLGDVLFEASESKEEMIIRNMDRESIALAREEVSYIDEYRIRLTPGGKDIDCHTVKIYT